MNGVRDRFLARKLRNYTLYARISETYRQYGFYTSSYQSLFPLCFEEPNALLLPFEEITQVCGILRDERTLKAIERNIERNTVRKNFAPPTAYQLASMRMALARAYPSSQDLFLR